MPVSTNTFNNTTTVSCTSCDTTRTVYDSFLHRGSVTAHGDLLTDTFAWHSGHGRPYTLCRSCTRTRAAGRRASTQRSRRLTAAAPLGIARQFGVELECYSNHTRSSIEQALTSVGLTVGRGTSAWTVKGDGSLNSPPTRGMSGVEITSPALSGEAGIAEIEKATRVLRDLGCQVNRSCGTHVHFDAADMPVDAMKRVAVSWSRNQSNIDWFVSESRRSRTSGYCQMLNASDVSAIESASTLEAMKRLYLDRYRTLNMAAYGKFGTVEIRQHQGTLSFEKIRTWVMFGQAVMDTAKVADRPMPQAATVREFLTALGDRLDETARTFLFGRAAEFGAPMSATVAA